MQGISTISQKSGQDRLFLVLMLLKHHLAKIAIIVWMAVLLIGGCSNNPSYAGVDFSMMSPPPAQYVPRFRNINEAVMWAHDKKWNDELMNKLDTKMGNLAILAVLNQHPRSNADNKHLLSVLEEYQACKIALSIMQRYKDDGIKGYPEGSLWNFGVYTLNMGYVGHR